MWNSFRSSIVSPIDRKSKALARKSFISLFALSLCLIPVPTRSQASAVEGGLESAEISSTGINPAPSVVPSMREWMGGTGAFSLGAKSMIIVDPNAAGELKDDAEVFAEDYATLSGTRLAVDVSGKPKKGDVFLTLDASLTKEEGYTLEIADTVTIRGKTDTGIFYGLQTILQILKQDPAHGVLPRGTASDYPDASFRSFMIDSGHTFATQEYIEDMIRQIAWHKMNTLHLHLTDGWPTDGGGFRLNSDKYPGLADNDASYTKEQIRHMEDLAKKYHINIIPEIDVPAHAPVMTEFNKNLRFTCAGLKNAYGLIDITKEQNRQWVKDMLAEFIQWFDGPIFHIGTDEYATQTSQESCSDIVQYRDDHGFGSTADVFVDFTNEMNEWVKSFGKRTMIWNWWDIDQTPTISPSKDIIVEAWRGDPLKYTAQGYDVVNSDEVVLYTGPTDPPGYPMDSNRVYKTWTVPQDPKLLGFSMSNWTGGFASAARPQPADDYFEWFNRRTREAMAERIWGGPLSETTAEFESRVDRIGTAPGVPEYAPHGGEKLTGTPYGTSPSYDDASGYASMFDGSSSTYFDYNLPNGGYAGIDMGAGNAKKVNKIRFLPRLNYTARVTYGKFQGSNEGPDKGFVDLFTIKWTADNGWTEVPVTDETPYRWLRYVGPDNGYTNMAEVEFYTAEPNDFASANDAIQAHLFSKKKGSMKVSKDLAPDNSSIGGMKAGNWLKYDHIDFGGGVYDTFMAMAALDNAASEGQPVEIRLDAEDGRRIGVLKPNPTGSDHLFKEQYAAISYVSGVHDVYLVFPSATRLQLNWFTFGTNPDNESAEAKELRTQWFTNARFGGMYRFGAFTQLAGSYNGQTPAQGPGELIMNWANIPKEDYLKQAAKPFNPSGFNAKAWVAAAKEAGEKYIVVTAKDRDGFSMYDTTVNDFRDFSMMKTSEYGRKKNNEDPVAALAAAAKEQGVKFGIYYSISDWFHPAQTRNADGTTTMEEGAKALYVSEMKEQLRELIEGANPDLIWFDGSDSEWWTAEDAKALYTYVRTLKSGIIVSSGIGSSYGDFHTFEEEEGNNEAGELPNEFRIPLGSSFGYVEQNGEWKTADTAVSVLSKAVSKGGNLLLGVGPKPDGTLPEESTPILSQIGEWMGASGDSIYDAEASIYKEETAWGAVTSKPGKLFLHVQQWPDDGKLVIPSLLNGINGVHPIADSSSPYAYRVNGKETVIEIPLEAPDAFDSVIVVEVDGIPQEIPGTPLLGEAYGLEPVYDPNSTFDKVFDGDVSTYYDYLGASDGYVGLDLGEGNEHRVTYIRFHPRMYYEGRMLGGKFQGSNEGPDKGFVDLATVDKVPLSTWNDIKVDQPGTYRWIRYVSPANGYTNIAEIQFYGE
ncbi:alpha-L-fucosidase [Paenibacillus sp. R14(2021)]|uniref:alpha-L-fucosidase n=1 Tax=Paenibacillus sp. R14(2021) TaxID=2859228 RepID=UPI001C6134F6|nr:alpha-L-fucosidase [Paenibacillus sp. R14(2021)]